MRSLYWLVGLSLRQLWAARGTGAAGPVFALVFAGAVAALTVVSLAGLVLSFSRGGLIGLAFGLLAMAVALGRRAAPALIAGLVGVVALAGLLIAGALPTAFSERISSTIEQLQIFDVRGMTPTPSTFNQIERLAHWQAAGNMYLSTPGSASASATYNVTFSAVLAAPTGRCRGDTRTTTFCRRWPRPGWPGYWPT